MAFRAHDWVEHHGAGRPESLALRCEEDGRWTLIRFRIHRFDVLGTESLSKTVAALRAVPGSEWKHWKDPLAELDNLRRDEDELH